MITTSPATAKARKPGRSSGTTPLFERLPRSSECVTTRFELKPHPPSHLVTNKRTDILFTSPATGETAIGDVRTALSTHPPSLSVASEVAGHAAHLAQLKKERAWEEVAFYSSSHFVPLAVEDGGRLGPALLNLIEEATFTSSTSASGSSVAALRTYARQRLHACNARGIAKTILLNPVMKGMKSVPPRAKPLFRDDLILELPQNIFPPKSRRTPLLSTTSRRLPPPWLQAPDGPPSASPTAPSSATPAGVGAPPPGTDSGALPPSPQDAPGLASDSHVPTWCPLFGPSLFSPSTEDGTSAPPFSGVT